MTKAKERFIPPGPYVAVGQIYGLLTVLTLQSEEVTDKPKWLCLCKCGTKKVVSTASLRAGTTQSCGCLRKGFEPRKTFAKAKSYAAWAGMKKKCNNPKDKTYKNHGAIGISYDPRWESFEEFHKDMGDGPIGHYFGRFNEALNFGPDNCKWFQGRGPKKEREDIGLNSNPKSNHYWKFPLKINTDHCLVDSNNAHVYSINGPIARNIAQQIMEALNAKLETK